MSNYRDISTLRGSIWFLPICIDHADQNVTGRGLSGTVIAKQLGIARSTSQLYAVLTLWQDADPNLPTLKQAKAEYAKLQRIFNVLDAYPY